MFNMVNCELKGRQFIRRDYLKEQGTVLPRTGDIDLVIP
jgi:hypothetical protein